MSISATAKFTNPEWRTVKEIEKSYLKKKYRRIPLKDVEVIGIDEIHLGKAGYRTIVIDLRSGAVLFIGHGRDVEALKPFKRKLASSSCQIKMVAVDMAPSYTKWVCDTLPEATIVYDHFHVIKLMGEKLDSIRRSEVRKAIKADNHEEAKINKYCERLEERALKMGIAKFKINKRIKAIKERFEGQARFIKGTRWILLGNKERIEEKQQARESLQKLEFHSSKLWRRLSENTGKGSSPTGRAELQVQKSRGLTQRYDG
jgi:transposase